MNEPIKIKPFTSVSYKIPTTQYGNVEVSSSISMEFGSDTTQEELQAALEQGKGHLEAIFKEVVEPDIKRKKAAYSQPDEKDPGTAQEHIIRSKILLALQMEDAGKLTMFMDALTRKSPYSKAETDRLIKMLTNRYNELNGE